jgi:hypothetical protein
MQLLELLLLVALILYTIVASHGRRFGIAADLTAIGLALVCFTLLVVSGTL